jgi:hypothetical protein
LDSWQDNACTVAVLRRRMCTFSLLLPRRTLQSKIALADCDSTSCSLGHAAWSDSLLSPLPVASRTSSTRWKATGVPFHFSRVGSLSEPPITARGITTATTIGSLSGQLSWSDRRVAHLMRALARRRRASTPQLWVQGSLHTHGMERLHSLAHAAYATDQAWASHIHGAQRGKSFGSMDPSPESVSVLSRHGTGPRRKTYCTYVLREAAFTLFMCLPCLRPEDRDLNA